MKCSLGLFKKIEIVFYNNDTTFMNNSAIRMSENAQTVTLAYKQISYVA